MFDKDELMKEAAAASKKAYAPYSKFRVGAAVLADDGKIYTGVNVENRSYGLTSCAERNAIFYAISQGMKKIKAVAIYSPNSEKILSPCGACRQVITEFSTPATVVISSDKNFNTLETLVDMLYPQDSLHELKENKINENM